MVGEPSTIVREMRATNMPTKGVLSGWTLQELVQRATARVAFHHDQISNKGVLWALVRKKG